MNIALKKSSFKRILQKIAFVREPQNVNPQPIIREQVIFLTETKCKIRSIYVRFNCKRKKLGKKMGGQKCH